MKSYTFRVFLYIAICMLAGVAIACIQVYVCSALIQTKRFVMSAVIHCRLRTSMMARILASHVSWKGNINQAN